MPRRLVIFANRLRVRRDAGVVGFQMRAGARNSSRDVGEFCQIDGPDGEVGPAGRPERVTSFPISIDVDEVGQLVTDRAAQTRDRAIRATIRTKRRIILWEDRLDTANGIRHCPRAMRELCGRGELAVKDTVLIQAAVPSRELIAEDAETREQIERTVGRINGEHCDPGKIVVPCFGRSLSRERLVASRVDLAGALLVSPHDLGAMGRAIIAALWIAHRAERTRKAFLRTLVKRHDVHDRARGFQEALA